MFKKWKPGLLVLVAAMLLMPGCGGEPAGETTAAEPAAAEPSAAEPEPEPIPVAVSAELTIPVVAGDGTHKAVVTKVLGEIVKEQRRGDYSNVTLLGKTTLSWVVGETRITLVNYPDVEALQEAAAEAKGNWDGALIVQDPGEPYKLHKEALQAAADAGVKKAVLFINVSDRLTDMEVYDLEAQSLPGWLASFGYEGEGMPVVTAHSDQAAAGDAGERATFGELLLVLERHLAGIV